MNGEWKTLLALRQGADPVEVLYVITKDSLNWKVDEVTHSIPLDQSLPRSLEVLRQMLEERYETTVSFQHCIHCINYTYSQMSLQMAKGRVGSCTLHKMSVDPLFACSDIFLFWDFRPTSFDGVEPPIASAELRKSVSDHLKLGEIGDLVAYKYGTCAFVATHKSLPMPISHLKVRLIRRHPPSILVSQMTDGHFFVHFGTASVVTMVSREDLSRWYQRHPDGDVTKLFLNQQVVSRLGLEEMSKDESMVASLAWCRAWLDAQHLTTADSPSG